MNTVLFDLDGTVLPMEFEKFMQLYFGNLAVYFHDLIDGKKLQKFIMESTEFMIKTVDGRSNEEKFFQNFESLIDGDVEVYKERFLEFYKTEFNNVIASTYKSEQMRKSIDLLKDKGYEVVLATNPLFPLIANHQRIKWAGFDPEEFSYISAFEHNSYCKPHVEYYLEVLDAIGKKPEDCMMVGNDVFDDLPAMKLGMETYLITDHLLNRYNQDITADYVGDYDAFYEFVKGLKAIY